jgi:hypothetical protein
VFADARLQNAIATKAPIISNLDFMFDLRKPQLAQLFLLLPRVGALALPKYLLPSHCLSIDCDVNCMHSPTKPQPTAQLRKSAAMSFVLVGHWGKKKPEQKRKSFPRRNRHFGGTKFIFNKLEVMAPMSLGSKLALLSRLLISRFPTIPRVGSGLGCETRRWLLN